METLNCIRCDFRHKDNGNCSAVGGFCTAVTAAHCPMLQKYLDTGLGPDEVTALQKDWSDLCTIVGECGGIDRLRELAEADKDGRLVVLPCKMGDTVYWGMVRSSPSAKCIGFRKIGKDCISALKAKCHTVPFAQTFALGSLYS